MSSVHKYYKLSNGKLRICTGEQICVMKERETINMVSRVILSYRTCLLSKLIENKTEHN
jgi:hypothetical protein